MQLAIQLHDSIITYGTFIKPRTIGFDPTHPHSPLLDSLGGYAVQHYSPAALQIFVKSCKKCVRKTHPHRHETKTCRKNIKKSTGLCQRFDKHKRKSPHRSGDPNKGTNKTKKSLSHDYRQENRRTQYIVFF